jgi:hypothetical protein
MGAEIRIFSFFDFSLSNKGLVASMGGGGVLVSRVTFFHVMYNTTW